MENDLLSAIAFLQRAILTSTKGGHIKLWIRPLAVRNRHLKGRNTLPTLDVHDLILTPNS